MTPRISKAEADYRPSKSPTARCKNCVYYQHGERCAKVSGVIKPSAVCDLFRAK